MATNLDVLINYVNADQDFANYASDFISVDLAHDYFIWTEGNAIVKDLMTAEPTAAQLNAAASIIPETGEGDKTVSKCLLMDYSHDVGGSYYTHLVKGMGENKKYVFCFSFDAATASEPQLEAWDTSAHSTANNHCLGNGTPANSFIKGVCTTVSLPGAGWAGTALAGASDVLLLNAGNGALSTPGSGLTNDLYANIKIVIPEDYSIPAAEIFVLTIRYTWN